MNAINDKHVRQLIFGSARNILISDNNEVFISHSEGPVTFDQESDFFDFPTAEIPLFHCDYNRSFKKPFKNDKRF